eukprot:PhF_6_TR21035/c0_g1_i1/m.30260/K01054/MGLL; acylglycerol lipase
MGCTQSDEHTVLRDMKDHPLRARPPPPPSKGNKYFYNKQKLWLRYLFWDIPQDVSPKGVVVIVHGFGEHIGRYQEIATLLTSHNFLVAGFDHQGHGMSEGDRAYVKKFSDYVDDAIQFAKEVVPKEIKERRGADAVNGLPFYLFGHSMGGLVSSHVLLRCQEYWKSAIISAPAVSVDPNVATPAKRDLAKSLSARFPKLTLDKLNAEWVCKDPVEVAKYVNDPLVYHEGLRVRFGAEMMGAMDEFWAKAPGITLPILLIHGSDDKLVPLEGSVQYVEKISSASKELKTYNGMYHESFRDPGKETVLNDIVQFFEK